MTELTLAIVICITLVLVVLIVTLGVLAFPLVERRIRFEQSQIEQRLSKLERRRAGEDDL